jgi:hypothetical protein
LQSAKKEEVEKRPNFTKIFNGAANSLVMIFGEILTVLKAKQALTNSVRNSGDPLQIY